MNTINFLLGAFLLWCSYSTLAQDQELDQLEAALENSGGASVTVTGLQKQTQKTKEENELIPSRTNAKLISLKGVIEEGLRRNYEQRFRKFARARFELDWEDSYEDF